MTSDAPVTKPDFFLVGAAKSGTTSLASYLDGHEQVFVSRPKEPNYFAFGPNSTPSCVGPAPSERLFEKLLKYTVTSPEGYDACFAGAGEGQQLGEASVRYLYEPAAAERIAGHAPGARVIALLRDPVARMHSHYHMNVKHGVEPLSFRDALAAEDERVAAGWGWDWHYRRVGQYGEQLERYYRAFGAEQVLVLFHADLRREPSALWSRLCQFLEIDPSERPDFGRQALVGSTPRVRWLRDWVWGDSPMKRVAKAVLPTSLRQRASQGLHAANTGRVQPIDETHRAELAPLFHEDGERLAELLGRRLPW